MVRRYALPFRKISSLSFQAYPFTAQEDEAFALQCGGAEMLKELRFYRTHVNDGVLRPISIGIYEWRTYMRNSQLFIGVARVRIWSFHITRNHPNARVFDKSKDTALNLASEHLRVLVDTFEGRIPLQDGMLIAYEGSVVYLEYTADFGMKEVSPKRAPIPQLPARPHTLFAMTRPIQTPLTVFPDLLHASQTAIAVEIWPDLARRMMRSEMRVYRAELSAAFLGLDFYRTGATLRAERVRAALAERPEQNILLVGHRGFVDYLVTGPFSNCELRSYTIAPDNTLVNVSQDL
ncbi:hypothetical protein B0H13DRAFT_2327277 [Mycena leptocephala]|nr:hypothetical protein B0H13DRAFT_2327277 [Mycena leptocephala]